MPVTNTLIGGITDSRIRSRAKIDGTSAEFVIYDYKTLEILRSSGLLTPDAQGMVAPEVTNLDPGTRYRHIYRVDGDFDTSKAGVFRTHGTLGEPFSFTFAASSCAAGENYPAEGNVLASDRISNSPVFSNIRAASPLFFIHMGDLHYYDLGSDNHGIVGGASLANYRRAYDDVLLQSRQQHMCRDVPFVYVQDDHDFDGNNSDGTFANKGNFAQVYRERIPHYDLAEATGAVYHSFQVGRVLFIISDERYERSPSTDPDGPSKTMLGSAQKTWMNDLLTTNPDGAELLIWVSTCQWLGGGIDGWREGYPTERDEMLTMFRDTGWEDRMVCISGNNHRIGLDSGGGNEERTGAKFPLFSLGSLDSVAAGNEHRPTYEYDRGPTVFGSGHWGTVSIRDRGHAIETRLTGWMGGQSWRSYTTLTDTSTQSTFTGGAMPWKVQIAPGCDLTDPPGCEWHDVTGFVRDPSGGRNISLGAGRPEEWRQSATSTAELVFNNDDGRFSTGNREGPYYPRLARNTPLRVRWGEADNDRFVGYVSKWPVQWDKTLDFSTAPIRASGIMRRLAQGQKALRSPLHRQITASNPIAYWSCEEGRNASSFASPVENVRPIRVEGELDFGSDDSLPGSEALPRVAADSQFYGRVPDRPSVTQFHAEFVLRIDEPPPDPGPTQSLLQIQTTGTIYRWQLRVQEATFTLAGFERTDPGLVQVIDSDRDTTDFFGHWIRLALFARQVGSDVEWKVRWFPIGMNGQTMTGTVVGADLGHVTHAFNEFGPDVPHSLEGMRFGHIAVFDAYDSAAFNAADTGREGELAGHRIERICNEEGILYTPTSDAIDTPPMGPQPVATTLNILRECETTDGGLLSEMDGGLTYTTRRARMNLPTAFTVGSGELAEPPQPVDDDQRLLNDITVSRPQGSSVRLVDQEHVESNDRYDGSVDANVQRDTQLEDIAGWRLHLGTVNLQRWPRVHLDLGTATQRIEEWLSFRLGQRLRIDHDFSQIAGVDANMLVDGWSEELDTYGWDVTMNAVPASPWDVAIVGGPNNIIDTSGSQLDAAVDETATSLSVATTEGPIWTTDAAHLPLEVDVDGEIVTVTAIVGTSSPQTFTVTRSVNGVVKSHTAGAPVNVAQHAIIS